MRRRSSLRDGGRAVAAGRIGRRRDPSMRLSRRGYRGSLVRRAQMRRGRYRRRRIRRARRVVRGLVESRLRSSGGLRHARRRASGG